jgi:hypothetical protein
MNALAASSRKIESMSHDGFIADPYNNENADFT